MRHGLATTFVIAAAAGAAALAQAPAPVLAFDAVSVKLNTSGSGNVSVTTTRGQINGINMPLSALIRMGYGVQDHQIVGLPEWAESARYDVVARGPNETGEPFRARIRQLLAERFKADLRSETREMPIYALVAMKPGTLGRALKPTAVSDCNTAKYCGTSINNRSIRFVSVTMGSMASTLSNFAGRAVLDRTSLEGSYDADLSFSSDARRPAAPGDDGPSLFTAVQEQLGLKLDAQRGPVSVVAIVRVEPPTED